MPIISDQGKDRMRFMPTFNWSSVQVSNVVDLRGHVEIFQEKILGLACCRNIFPCADDVRAGRRL